MTSYVNSRNLSSRAKIWLKQVKPYNRDNLKPNRSRAVLIVIDMQKFFLDPTSSSFTCGGLPIIPNVQRLITLFRQIRRPIIYTRHVHDAKGIDAGIMKWWWDDMCIAGTPESEIHDDLAPCPGERVIIKHRYDAFYNTGLETVLRGLKIKDIIITGIMTNMCCESTARGAYYRDYRVFFPVDATGTVTEEMHTASLLNLAFGFAVITNTPNLVRQIGR
nr:cysteine hydrolase [candidate division Zixibacteria bacterium]